MENGSQLKQLSSKTIAAANEEAKNVLSKLPECATSLALGGAGSILLQSPAPFALGAANCLPYASAKIENVHDGVITLQPGQWWFGACNRKIAVCKTGPAAGDKDKVAAMADLPCA